ncbi:MAG: transglycosylase SLT domain-containing protein [bacterium]|nr:transglycosylase SLT domain-containing protein [bacterium]
MNAITGRQQLQIWLRSIGRGILFVFRKGLVLAFVGTLTLFNLSGLSDGRRSDAIAYHEAVTEARTRISAFVNHKNARTPAAEKELLIETILKESERLRIPAHFSIDGRPVHPAYFVTALIAVESTFKREAVSHADARGYMQLMPQTVAWMDDNLRNGHETRVEHLFETPTNIARGVTYLNFLIEEMGDIRLVCLAYNAGPGAVSRGFWVERYWQKIYDNYREIQRGEFMADRVYLAAAF